jgi:hypothetical protein
MACPESEQFDREHQMQQNDFKILEDLATVLKWQAYA